MFITVVTNGTFTSRIKDVVTKFCQNFPDTSFRLVLSVDAIGEEHDESRVVKGLFNKLMESYAVLEDLRKKYSNIIIDVHTTFTKYNQDKAEKIADWIRKNMKADNHTWSVVRGNVKDKLSKDINVEKYLSLFTKMVENKKRKENRALSALWRASWEMLYDTNYQTLREDKMVRQCRAGRNLVELYDNGDIHFCEILDNKIGNIRDFDYDIKKVLSTQKSRNLRKWIKNTKCHCTFECANTASIGFNPKTYPTLLKKAVINFVQDKSR